MLMIISVKRKNVMMMSYFVYGVLLEH